MSARYAAMFGRLKSLPLTFVGGVFYSIEVLPSPWEQLSHANPIFYVVDAVRYGVLGTSEVGAGLSFAIANATAESTSAAEL